MVFQQMDPKAAIEAWLTPMIHVNERWSFLNEYGSWGDTEQPDWVAEIGTDLVSTVDPEAGECYKNSFEAVLDSNHAEVEYVEGLAFVRGSVDPTKHAWVEVDGSVIELTWGHRTELPTPPAKSAYYGYTIPSEELTQLAFELEHHGPFLPHYVE